MIPNEQPSPFGQRPQTESWKPAPENTLKFEQMHIERKTFFFTLKENQRGRFLRVTEDTGDRHSNLVIPSSGLEEFKKMVDEMIQTSSEIP